MKKLTPKEFVVKYSQFAKETESKTGIDARFILAQAALESGWGAAAVGNMFFGVKASNTTPLSEKQLLTTREVLQSPTVIFPEIIAITKRADGRYDYKVKDWFRKYASPEQSFTDHAQFFMINPRYRSALKVKHDPYLFAEEIAKAGYATDTNYAEILQAVIRTIEKAL